MDIQEGTMYHLESGENIEIAEVSQSRMFDTLVTYHAIRWDPTEEEFVQDRVYTMSHADFMKLIKGAQVGVLINANDEEVGEVTNIDPIATLYEAIGTFVPSNGIPNVHAMIHEMAKAAILHARREEWILAADADELVLEDMGKYAQELIAPSSTKRGGMFTRIEEE